MKSRMEINCISQHHLLKKIIKKLEYSIRVVLSNKKKRLKVRVNHLSKIIITMRKLIELHHFNNKSIKTCK